MRITTETLKARNACSDQVRLFAETFPTGATVTLRNLAKARKAGLETEWLTCLLSAAALAEYDKVTAPALVAAFRGMKETR